MSGPFVLRIPRRLPPTEVVNHSDVSCLYQSTRDASGEGASTFPEGVMLDTRGKIVGWVSYNGCIWDRKGDNRVLIYDPAGIWPEGTEARF